MIAQLSSPDMRVPIAHCLAWPDRIDGSAPRLDLARIGSLTFEAPDPGRFPALRVARAAMDAGGGATTILNAANEIAVDAFLNKRVAFGAIVPLVEETLHAASNRGVNHEPENVEDALSIDHVSRSLARELLPQIAAKAF
jgi:1-deoxy-D-xylulose-5-phosphate reductoisomerase